MGDLIDFNKAKQETEQKKKAEKAVKEKNAHLIKKMKRYDRGKRSPIYYYGIILLVITLITLIRFFIL